MTICGFVVCDDGHHFAGYAVASAEDALFCHISDGGAPERTTDPSRDSYGWWFKGAIEVYAIYNHDLLSILTAEDLTSLECEGEGDFVAGRDFVREGCYRWGDLFDEG